MNASRNRRLALALFAVLIAPLVILSAVAADSPLEMLANKLKADEEKDAPLRRLAADIDLAKAKRDYPAAIALTEKAMALDPDHSASWLFSRGHFHMWLGDFDAARADFEKAIELDDDDVLLLGRVQVDLYTGKYEDAEEELLEALDENLGPTRAYFDKRGRRDDDDAIAAYARGRCWLSTSHGDRSPEKALAEFDRAIALRPTLAPAYTWRGKIHADNGAHDLALADFSRAVDLEPDNPANIRGRAEEREATGDLDGAIADWDRYVELRPDTLGIEDDGRFHRARICAKQGKFDLALADYDSVERSHATSARILIPRAFVHGKRGDIDSAMADIRKGVADDAHFASIISDNATKADPSNALARVALGFSYAADTKANWAMDEFAEAIEIDAATAQRALAGTGVARAFFQRAVEAAEKKERDAALADISRALALEPGSADMLAARGTLHAQMRNAQLALDDFNSALKQSPDNAGIRLKRGMILAAMDEDELAINDFTRVIELEPSNAQAYLRRAALYKRVGFEDRSQADYARAVELDPNLKR